MRVKHSMGYDTEKENRYGQMVRTKRLYIEKVLSMRVNSKMIKPMDLEN